MPAAVCGIMLLLLRRRRAMRAVGHCTSTHGTHGASRRTPPLWLRRLGGHPVWLVHGWLHRSAWVSAVLAVCALVKVPRSLRGRRAVIIIT